MFGYNRIGFSILGALKKMKENYLIIDFNPDVISDLSKLNIPSVYGDVGDPELLRELPLSKLKLAISTVPDFETNELLIDALKDTDPRAIIIVRAHTIKDALALYERGANYVLTPHFLGGEYVAKMIKDLGTVKKDYKEEKEKHIKMLKDMLEHGKEHPEVEKD